MEIKETELPGIGKKFEFTTSEKEKFSMILHDDGKREIYHYDIEDEEEALSNITLSDEESRQFSSILGGMVYKPKQLENIELEFGHDFKIKWLKIEEGAPVSNKTIGNIDIRNNFGIIIIGIIKKDKTKVFNPGPDSLLEEGDTLIISGENQSIKDAASKLLFKGGS